MKLTHQILSACTFLTLNSAASAAVVYTNNFDSETLGTVSGAMEHVGGPGSYFDVVAANANFGSQHGELASRSDNHNYAFGNFDGGLITDPGWAAVTTFSFDLRVNSATFAGVNAQTRMRARDTGFAGGTTDTARFDLNDGTITANTVHAIDYVVNNSSSAATAPGVGGTIPAGSYAIYSDGGLLASGSNFTAADDLAVDKLTLWVRGDAATTLQSVVQIDNFEVHVNDPIPEPSGIALLGLGSILALGARRRK